MFLQVILFLFALIMMLFAAHLLIDSVEKICKQWNLSSLGMGVLIFGFMISLPHLFHAHMLTRQGDFGRSLGIVVGALICNIFLTYGMAGLFGRLLILRRIVYLQFLYQLSGIFLMGLFLYLGYFQILSGLILLTFFLIYLYNLPLKDKGSLTPSKPIGVSTWGRLIFGLIAIYAGGELFIWKGLQVGEGLKISSAVLSMIVIGFSISIPQLLISLWGMTHKKNSDFITGNMVGANIFNICLVFASLCFYQLEFSRSFSLEWIVLLIAALFLVGLVKMKTNFYRISGVIFVTIYFSLIFYWSAYSS